jgi:MFS family permease
MATAGFFDIERTAAPPDFDRWRVPAAAFAAHLAVGQTFAFGAFREPLARHLGLGSGATGDSVAGIIDWIVPVAMLFLGLAAFVSGSWVDRAGPRRAMMTSATVFGGGLIVAAVGVQLQSLATVFLGVGVLCGIGLGIGYLAPIPTLIGWFPDRPALSTGLAITGLGAGALFGSALAEASLRLFAGPDASGVAESLIVMAIAAFALMTFGIATVRVPALGWRPPTFTSKPIEVLAGPVAPRVGSLAGRSVGERREAAPDVRVERAVRTPQLWLLWGTLFCTASATFAIFAMAAPMLRISFPYIVTDREAAGFVALLWVAEVLGPLAWSATSDLIGFRRAFLLSLTIAASLVTLIPSLIAAGSFVPLVTASALVCSVRSGIFAAVPAAVRGTFGVAQIGAIHGRLLGAWAAAAFAGPALAAWIINREPVYVMPRAETYALPMYATAGLFAVALLLTFVIAPVHPRYHDKPLSGFRG